MGAAGEATCTLLTKLLPPGGASCEVEHQRQQAPRTQWQQDAGHSGLHASVTASPFSSLNLALKLFCSSHCMKGAWSPSW